MTQHNAKETRDYSDRLNRYAAARRRNRRRACREAGKELRESVRHLVATRLEEGREEEALRRSA